MSVPVKVNVTVYLSTSEGDVAFSVPVMEVWLFISILVNGGVAFYFNPSEGGVAFYFNPIEEGVAFISIPVKGM